VLSTGASGSADPAVGARMPTGDGTERIGPLLRDLPPPVVSGAGQKTYGRWIDPEGNVHSEVSGKDQKSEAAVRFFEEEMKSRRILGTVVDVEIKLAVHMRKSGIRSTTLMINNLPCRGPMGCNALVPVVLPLGYTMTVYGPRGFKQQYKGGGTSKWVP
jgi:hypothetical protein